MIHAWNAFLAVAPFPFPLGASPPAAEFLLRIGEGRRPSLGF